MAAARIRLPSHSALVGRSVAQSGLRTRTGALIVSIRRGSRDIAAPPPSFRLAVGDELVVVGEQHQLKAATDLLTARPA